MVAVLQRLQSCGFDLPIPCDEGSKEWVFQQKISKKDINFFRYFADNHQAINIEYSVHCAHLAHNLARKNVVELTQQIEAALMMAELLEILYRDYLIVPREVIRLRNEQSVYRSMLAHQKYQFSSDHRDDVVDTNITKNVRERTAPINWSRLLLARIRKFLVLASPVVHHTGYSNLVTGVDAFASPIFNYASWLVFIPRLSTNLFLLAKHLLPGAWMSKQEEALGWQIRLKAQLQRRWFEIGNDLAAMSVNIINCFVLIGALSPIGLYATAALLTFDVVYACLRVYIEVGRLKKLEQQYNDMLIIGNLPVDEHEQTKEHLVHLRQRIAYEEKRLYIQVALTTTLVLALALTFPFFAVSPVIPLIGALIAIIATIGYFSATKKVEQQKPVDKISPALAKESSLASHRFFKPSREAKSDTVLDPQNTSSKDMLLPLLPM